MTRNEPHSYRIASMKVFGLWGSQDFDLAFAPDVNIIVGPNASGKTTILNLIHHTFSGRFFHLGEIDFLKLEFGLRSFDGSSVRTVHVDTTDEGFKFKIWSKEYSVSLASGVYASMSRRPYRRRESREQIELRHRLQSLVPSVWLPVSRRLPVADDSRTRSIARMLESRESETEDDEESVDQKLRELLDGLENYRLRLDSQLSEQYKEFERKVVQLILYNSEYDAEPRLGPRATEEEKKQLLRALDDADLLDDEMRRRVGDHFEKASTVFDRWSNQDEYELRWEDYSIIPLLRRTRTMVDYAREIDQHREDLFTPLATYVHIVNGFFKKKMIDVTSDGELRVYLKESPQSTLEPFQLSSGEKQILILLTQALLKEDDPVVYVADEPELSLHVTWQERLLSSLVELGQQIQIIVATHSPDIIGEYVDNVISLQ